MNVGDILEILALLLTGILFGMMAVVRIFGIIVGIQRLQNWQPIRLSKDEVRDEIMHIYKPLYLACCIKPLPSRHQDLLMQVGLKLYSELTTHKRSWSNVIVHLFR